MMRRLPPGFRFEPTEEELVFEYLKCKVFSSALPASIIPDINGVWNLDPWDIPPGGGGREEDKYLFSKKESEAHKNNNYEMGISRSGYWKARGWEKEIVSSEIGNPLMGMKKTLDFIIGSRSSSSSSSKRKTKTKTKKTGWVMHEYRLLLLQPHYSNTNTNLENNNKWVLCRIFFNKFNHDHIIHRRLHYSISSTNHLHHHHDDHLILTALSDDDDSVSSTASSSSTSAATTTTTTTIQSPTILFPPSN